MQINTLRLRAILGWLGGLLPWIVLILSLVFENMFPDSISATYYYDTCITPFMITVGAAGILLICYNGYDKQDDIICTIAGIAGLLICLFPCDNEILYELNYCEDFVGTFHCPILISGIIHDLSAVVFFLLLAYNSYFLFTKGSDNPTPNKLKRNKIFKICGIGMAASLVCIPIIAIFKLWGGTWIVEAIALGFFSISWLTKADIYPWLFCDTPYVD